MLDFKIKLFGTLILFAILLDLYLWQAVKVLISNRPKYWQNFVKFIFWVVPLVVVGALVFSMFNSNFAGTKFFRTYLTAAYFIIYFSKLVTFLFLVIDDFKRLLVWLSQKVNHLFFAKNKYETEIDEMEEEIEQAINTNKITRSQFISRAGIIAGTVPFVILSKGVFSGAYNYKLHRKEIFLPNLPDVFDGLKILQISDVHTGSFYNKDAVYKGIQLIKEQKPDMVFFTGDFVNNKTNEAFDWMDFFAQIKAPMGVYSIFGNHDYGDYTLDWKSKAEKDKNLADLVAVHKDMGWHLLRNEHVVLERENHRLAIIGVENWGDRGRFQKYGDIDVAIKGMPDAPVKLLLSHDPSHFDSIVSKKHKDIDVTFSGHTHGFQFGIELGRFRWSPSQYIYPHWAGLYKVGEQQLYVNRGFGFLGYPGRVGIMPEISVFNLSNRA